MALMEVNFYSDVLGMCTSANVIIPQPMPGIGIETDKLAKPPYPVLYLLHGASQNHTGWVRHTNIERYVGPLGLAVVMPEVGLSRYENMVHGQRYYDYIADELPEKMSTFFRISQDPSSTYIAGLSMGGTAAMTFGLTRPEQYRAVGILSAGNAFYHAPGKTMNVWERPSGGHSGKETIYGVPNDADLRGSRFDPFPKAEKLLEEGKKMPRFFHVCGYEDYLRDSARLTRDWFQDHAEIDYTYIEAPGAHTWSFWDKWIQEFLKWLNTPNQQ